MVEQGIEDDSLMKSLGIIFISLIIIALIMIIYFLFKWCNKKYNCGKKILDAIRKKVFYSAPIRYIIVGYLKLLNQFLSMVFFGIIRLENGGMTTAYGFACLIFIIWPLFSAYFLLVNHEKAENSAFKTKFSSMYQGIRTDSFLALCYTAVFSVRRFDIIIMNHFFTAGSPLSGIDRTFYMHKIFCFIFIQYAYLFYVHYTKPHSESIYNKLEYLNEYCMVALAYIMLNFTKLLPIMNPTTNKPFPIDTNFNTNIEYVAIAIILFMTMSNFWVMIRMSYMKCKNSLKKKKALKKFEKLLHKELNTKVRLNVY